MLITTASLSAEQARRLAIYFAFQYPAQPFLTATPYQHLLLETFLRGQLSMDQVLVHLEAHEYERERQPTIALA
ncbi:hypothetical protein [Hymenobacter volaticus]|uniref:Uncharacterized protein n=1 Tax=Hymenobacter volaticus TaxID=2932254 RepID=A0ABY4GER2_9BACT|nr:hypothetical protein [Hymenobacter volaticus]UOQ69418.1 hypothetical protein MUN86_27430 [Hymenobacter volaticus]